MEDDKILNNSLGNTMFGEVDIRGFNEVKIDGSITVRKDHKSNFSGLLDIPLFDNLEKIDGSLTVKQEGISQFKGLLLIDIENSLIGELDILDTPENKHYGVLVKDAYTSVQNPNVNYGRDTILHFSNDTTVFLEYTVSPNDFYLFDQENELEAYLNINLTRAIQQEAIGEIYLVKEAWYEDGINENNKPSVEFISNFNIPTNYVGWIEIPLGDQLKQFDKFETFTYSLAIKINTNEFTRSYSKEGNIELSPQLYYKYQYIPPSMRIRNLQGRLTVRLDDEARFNGVITVDSIYEEEKLQGKLNVPLFENENKFSGNLFVIQRPIHEKFNGLLNVPLFENEDSFSGQMIVKEIGIEKINGQLNIPIFNNEDLLHGKLIVELEKEARLSGLLNIPLLEEMDKFSGQMIIERDGLDKLQGQLNVPLFEITEKFKGQLVVERINEDKFSGQLEIPLFEKTDKLQGQLTVRLDDEYKINGVLDVPLFENEDKFNGDIFIQEMWRDMFDGKLDVPRFTVKEEFYGKIHVPKTLINQVKGRLYVPSDRRSRAYVYIM